MKKTKEHAESLGIDLDRAYRDYKEMAKERPKGMMGLIWWQSFLQTITMLSLLKAFLEEGIHVLCEKPLATNAQEAFT